LVAFAARYGDVVAFHAMSLAAAAEKIAAVRALSSVQERPSPPRFWINLNILVGETDHAAYHHLRELEQAIRRLLEFRSCSSGGSGIRSIREDRFADLALAEDQWEDGVLYLGLTALSRSTPTLVGSPSTIADAVLAYHDLGIGVVTLGSHVTSSRDAELRQETLRLIRQTVTVRDAAADRAA